MHEADSPITFSPDGKRIAYVRSGHPDPDKFSLLTAAADGSDEKTLVSGTMGAMPNFLAWTPDGKSIAAVTYEAGDYISEIVKFDVASGQSKRMRGYKDSVLAYLTWLPSGDGMLLTSESRSSGSMRQQIGYVEAGRPDIRFVTQDTNIYGVLRLSSDGKTLSAIQHKSTYSLFDFPAAGMAPGTATPAGIRQERDIYGFGWAPENALYVTDGGKLIAPARTAAMKRRSSAKPKRSSRTRLRAPRESMWCSAGPDITVAPL